MTTPVRARASFYTKKTTHHEWSSRTGRDWLLCALDVTCFEALRANVRTFDLAIEFDRDLLDVRTEGTIGYAVGVADAATGHGVLTANFTNLGHFSHSITSDNL